MAKIVPNLWPTMGLVGGIEVGTGRSAAIGQIPESVHMEALQSN